MSESAPAPVGGPNAMSTKANAFPSSTRTQTIASLEWAEVPSAVAGTATRAAILLHAFDSRHRVITGVYATPIEVAVNGGASPDVVLLDNGKTAQTVASSRDKLVLAYDGRATLPVKLYASASPAVTATATFAPRLDPIGWGPTFRSDPGGSWDPTTGTLTMLSSDARPAHVEIVANGDSASAVTLEPGNVKAGCGDLAANAITPIKPDPGSNAAFSIGTQDNVGGTCTMTVYDLVKRKSFIHLTVKLTGTPIDVSPATLHLSAANPAGDIDVSEPRWTGTMALESNCPPNGNAYYPTSWKGPKATIHVRLVGAREWPNPCQFAIVSGAPNVAPARVLLWSRPASDYVSITPSTVSLDASHASEALTVSDSDASAAFTVETSCSSKDVSVSPTSGSGPTMTVTVSERRAPSQASICSIYARDSAGWTAASYVTIAAASSSAAAPR